MGLRKVGDIVVFRDDAWYCGPGPSVIVFPDGEIAVFFRRHRWRTGQPIIMHFHPTTEQCVVRSFDGGKSWSAPRVFLAGGQCPCATLLEDGTLLWTTHEWDILPPELFEPLPEHWCARPEPWPHACVGSSVRRSTNRGETWEGPAWVDGVPGSPPLMEGWHAPMAMRGWPLQLQDGSVAMPLYALGNGCVMASSEDGGRSWKYRAHVVRCPEDQPKAYDEWCVHQTPSGDLVALIRSDNPPEQGGGRLHMARSSDGGATWSAPQQHDVWGHPHHTLTMPSGRVLLSYGYRREPLGVRCRLVEPEMRAPAEAEELVLRDDGGCGDLGYPHAALLPDGRAIVAYYFNSGGVGQRYVAASVVEEC